MSTLNVLVIDDEPVIRQVLTGALVRAGHAVDSAPSAEEASLKLAKGDVDVAICDIKMGGMSGLDLLKQTKAAGIDTAFIIVTAFASMDSAIEALKAGASDYIVKPVRNEEILHRLSQIAALRGLRNENRTLRNIVLGTDEERFRFASPPMVEVDRLVSRVAPTASTVLITGESGTGKGIVARQIHELSPRRDGPFIPVNCSAIPENLLESELFGHTKGAFTSADRARKGLFLQADGGTIFLDEIGELPLPMQTKLLHVIEDKQVRPLGAEQSRTVDVRIVAATNRNLLDMVGAGRFREDLYFRLDVFHIVLPSLRERRQDIPSLIRYFVQRQRAHAPANRVHGVDPVAEEVLVGYAWPGNIRELENAISRALVLADGDRIELSDLPADIARSAPAKAEPVIGLALPGTNLREQMRRFEAGMIFRAIDDAGGDRRIASQRLGIGLSSLYRKLEEYESLKPVADADRARANGGGR
jgi:two-component system response regulator AtoC